MGQRRTGSAVIRVIALLHFAIGGNMGPIYLHCPHCGFPTVVRAAEHAAARHCRQCRRVYVPDENRACAELPARAPSREKQRQRKSIFRSLLQHRDTL